MTDLLERTEENLQKHHLPGRSRTLLVAVSGGLDSMVLLHVLCELSKEYRWKLAVAHFNHQLRGQSSDADEKLVSKTAAGFNLPFVCGRAGVREFAEKSGTSVEMAARKLRHEFLVRAARERGISTIALAHHADDQVELFFLRLLRGAGAEGLAGMKWRSVSPADKRVSLIRPLLNMTKLELRAFAREKKITFREDATNSGLDMPRNRVRNELLPLLRRRYQPALTRAILRLMEIVGLEAEVVSAAARQWIEDRGKHERSKRLQAAGRGLSGFDDLPIAVQRRVLQLQLAEQGITGDFDLIERLRCSPNVFVSISRICAVARDSTGRVCLRSMLLARFQKDQIAVTLSDAAGKVSFGDVEFRWNFDVKKRVRSRRQAGRELFDADKVGGTIVLRHWRAGDRFQPIGMQSAVKLQDLFTNQKIPRARRHELIVAEAANGEIFWVQDVRMAEAFKVTDGTKRCLAWCWRPLK